MSSGCGNYNQFGRAGDDDEGGDLVPNEGEKRRQFQAAILAALAATAAGTSDGWLMTSLVRHKEMVTDLYPSNMFLFMNIMNLAAFTAAIVSGYLVEKIGRKQTLVLAGLLTLPTWILYTISHKIVISLSIGTALGGFASGAVSVAVPLYIAEISESSIRGTLGIFFYLQFIAGELFTTIEGKDIHLNVVATNCILVATIFLITFIWMPESPYSLLTKREENDAKISIKFFRGANYHIEEEVENLKQAVSKRTKVKEALQDDNTINALFLSLTLMFICRLVAVDGFNFRLYKLAFHMSSGDESSFTTFFLLIQIIALLGAAFFIERLGRRLLLIISASVMMLSCAVFLLADAFVVHTTASMSLFFSAVYVTAFSIGVGPIPWVLMTELFPHQHKVLSSTLSAGLFWFMAFISAKRYNLLMNSIGLVGLMIHNIILCVFIILIVIFLLPETKGRNSNSILLPDINKLIFQRRINTNLNV